MNALQARHGYASEWGWRITLPNTWEKLESSSDAPLSRTAATVFSTPQDWSLSLTWMRAHRPISDGLRNRFQAMTMLTRKPGPNEILSIIGSVFPPIGVIIDAQVVKLPDGTRALEIVEAVEDRSTGVITRQGYQLFLLHYRGGITQLTTASRFQTTPVYLERLAFYADSNDFMRMLPEIVESARSFHY